MKLNISEKAGLVKEKLAAYRQLEDELKEVDLKDVPVEKRQALDTLTKEINDLSAEVEEAKGYEATRAKHELLSAAINAPVNRPQFANTDSRHNGDSKSEGQRFVESPEIKEWLEKGLGLKGPGASIPDKMRIDSPAVDVKGLIITANNSGGAFVRRDYDDNVMLPLRPLTIRNVISIGRTGSNLVEYVRQTAKTRAAAMVPEATSTSGSGYTASAKPEASMAFEIVQAPVKTIAVWMPITRQILADAPQLESEIDQFEQDDLQLALEEAIISGGGGTSFIGLENTPGITPQAFVPDALDSTGGYLTTARKARTTALIVGRAQATGFLLNPYDWEKIDLARATTTNNFYFGGPTVMGVEQLWGLPVIQSEVIPQGTGYTGNLKLIRVWDREEATRRITDSHSDFFTHNLIAILTELRAAMGVKRPAGIVKIDFVAGANS